MFSPPLQIPCTTPCTKPCCTSQLFDFTQSQLTSCSDFRFGSFLLKTKLSSKQQMKFFRQLQHLPYPRSYSKYMLPQKIFCQNALCKIDPFLEAEKSVDENGSRCKLDFVFVKLLEQLRLRGYHNLSFDLLFLFLLFKFACLRMNSVEVQITQLLDSDFHLDFNV